MKKVITILLLIISFNDYLSSQIINQDSDGYSTIVLPNVDFSLDLKNNVAKFSFYNFIKSDSLKPMLGIEIKASEKDGIGNLFSKGSLANNSSINVLYKIGKGQFLTPKRSYAFNKHNIKKRLSSLQDSLKAIAGRISINNPKDSIILMQMARNADSDILEDRYNQISDADLKEFIRTNYYTVMKDKCDSLDNIRRNQNMLKMNAAYFGIYFRGGINYSSFKYDTNNVNENLDKRFIVKDYTGGNIEIGINYSKNNTFFFGISYKGDWMSNMNTLKKVEYKFSKTEPDISSGALTTSQTINSLSGDYDDFYRSSFNVDAVRVLALGEFDEEKNDYYLTLNAFFRHHWYSDSETLKPNSSLGFGINAFSSSRQAIMGGLFVQRNDLSNNNDELEGLERLSIGIVAKYSFSGFAAKKK